MTVAIGDIALANVAYAVRVFDNSIEGWSNGESSCVMWSDRKLFDYKKDALKEIASWRAGSWNARIVRVTRSPNRRNRRRRTIASDPCR